MISGLTIGNFKAFSETQHIPIRPITIIFGPNSSGKSSIIHSLILAHEALRTGNLDINRTELGGDSIDLGGFKQYIYNRDADRSMEYRISLRSELFEGRLKEIFHSAKEVMIEITVGMVKKDESAVLYETFKEITHDADVDMNEMQVSDLLDALRESESKGRKRLRTENKEELYLKSLTLNEWLKQGNEPKVTSYAIRVDGESFLKMSRRMGGVFRIDTINDEHPVMKELLDALILSSTTTGTLTNNDYELLKSVLSDLVSKISTEPTDFIPLGIQEFSKDPEDYLIAISKDKRAEDMRSAFHLFIPRILHEILSNIASVLESQFNRLKYLGPLRSYPPRHVAFTQYHDSNWYAGGGFAWEEVRKRIDLRNKINQWLGDAKKLKTPYELRVRHLLTIDDLDKHYQKRIGLIEEEKAEEEYEYEEDDGTTVMGDMFGDLYNVLNDLKILEPQISEIGELVLLDKRTGTVVSHRDVGIGVSQVLPVLVSAYANKNSVIAIEQPEIHLHPALQAELGDVFIESALGENKNIFLIESHSEHLILRILKRVRQTARGQNQLTPPIKPEDISMLYVEGTSKGAYIRSLRVDEQGRIIDRVPGGFFEEDFEELF
ncbi:MAG: AAA family ATPase [Syntrophales bacterium]|jgi:AAA15 family ATPase/GTPase|nr:AAA family ATPase [Syntrophales bacterium]